MACSSIQTWLGSGVAFVNIHLTELPSELRRAGAEHGALCEVLGTRGPIHARLWSAEVDIYHAVPPIVSRSTFTGVVGHEVCAGGVVAARIGRTVIDVDLACAASESITAHALKSVHLIHTYAIVLTRIRGTVINIQLAQRASETCTADTQEAVIERDTGSVVHAGHHFTDINLCVAELTSEPRRTEAGEAVTLVNTRGTVLAVQSTQPSLTEGASESFHTNTRHSSKLRGTVSIAPTGI